MFTIPFFLYLLAFALTIASIVTPKVPLWISVLLLSIGLLVSSAK
jgi:hypothetical protein